MDGYLNVSSLFGRLLGYTKLTYFYLKSIISLALLSNAVTGGFPGGCLVYARAHLMCTCAFYRSKRKHGLIEYWCKGRGQW